MDKLHNKEIIIATKNKGKAKEFERLFAPYHIRVLTLLDFPDVSDIEETGNTFEENALLKAEAISKQFHTMVISDDSGLVIDALNGRPGVFSARFAGENKDDEANINKVLSELKDVPQENRTARFYCAIALAIPDEKTITVSGVCEGEILKEKRGTNGFGYDPIFFIKEKGLTMAELSSEEKNKLSHRAKAIQKLFHEIKDLLI
ncbi:XTP/dITP diphosphatase [Bacillus sp. FJAT-49736]|uniref:XTP/dITP diphosphatase n=1 Tax=Bacillus sp. FJAT-49736 TaxID=2833582 RepID=UPI001BC9AEE3|nr:XTP/dITP diphosphatase [Bacillus sp. FJAT-49736]MBS4173738.1 XTP/dITP diphosphatase [Bacillus sp. FJAT-49736]